MLDLLLQMEYLDKHSSSQQEGFHGVHVIIGTIFIGVAFFRMLSYHLTDHHHLGFEASILYWHFVDVVWLFLFISVGEASKLNIKIIYPFNSISSTLNK